MSVNVRISEDIVKAAKLHGKIYNRSVPMQIEFWSKIGKIAEENPDLSYELIRGILISLEEEKMGLVYDYEFSS